MKPIFLKFFILVLCLVVFSCSQQGSPMVTINGETMGTTYTVKYLNKDATQASPTPTEMKNKIDKLLVEINQLMSTYIPDSELSRLNQAPQNVAFPISEATQYVIQEAIDLHKLSKGMLDITVGPLVNQWGFGPSAKAIKIPTKEQIIETMTYVGIDKFSLENGQIVKQHPKVYIDLSTIAKGYGVDEVAELLLSEGFSNHLVEIGGEMRLSGKKMNDESWLVAIEKPLSGQRSIQRIVNVGDNAIATSGDYRNYFEEDSVRYSHLINPKTGYPIQHKLVAVTVVAPKSIRADGLATALMVMGTQAGRALAEQEDIAALFITKDGDNFVEHQSTRFIEEVEIIEQKPVR